MKAIAPSKTTAFQIWIRTQKKFRSTKKKVDAFKSGQTSRYDLHKLTSKLDRLGKRLLDLNRKWRLGFATATLLTWMSIGSAQAQSTVFPAQQNLSGLDGTDGFILKGIDGGGEESIGDFAGRAVSNAGDVNGDGVDDFIIGAHQADPNGEDNAGETYVVFGQTGSFGASFDLSGLDGTNGFVIEGIEGNTIGKRGTPGDIGDNSGRSVSGVGDVNNDGFDDIIIGAPYADPNGTSSGASYVIFGKNTGFSDSFDLSSLDGTNGFSLLGSAINESAGRSLSSAGDVNADGISDIMIGSFGANNDDEGRVYIVFGKSTGFGSSLELSSLNGTNGFVIEGNSVGDNLGQSVSEAGDINHDGIDDLLIGAPDVGSGGATYVIFGKNTGFSANLDPLSLDGSNGFVIAGIDANDDFGTAVSAAGDVNGDGIDDLIMGAPSADPDGNSNAGETYVVFGKDTGFSSSFDLSVLDGTNGFIIHGVEISNRSGYAISNADVNGDGLSDIVIGAYYAGQNDYTTGEAYVVFGSTEPFGGTFELSSLVSDNGSDGFVLSGIDGGDRAGASVSNAGDINNDGVDDLIIGAYRASPDGRSTAGEAYIVFGIQYPEGIISFPIANQEAIEDQSFEFVLPEETFATFIGNESVVSRSAMLANGDPLPQWLSFGNGTFTGIPDQIDVGVLSIEVTAIGSNGTEATTTFDLTVIDGDTFPATVHLSALASDNGAEGFAITGLDVRSSNVWASCAGDINGDGLDDVLLGAHRSSPNDLDRAGETYVVFGSNSTFQPVLPIADLDGLNGFTINGVRSDDGSGFSVSDAGDMNGDGFDDILIGTYYASSNGEGSGEGYVVFGKNTGFSGSLELSDLDGTDGFSIPGRQEYYQLGYAVSGVGDINGDGFDDIIVSEPYSSKVGESYSYEGRSYVILGKGTGFGDSFDLSTLDGTNGFFLEGIDANDFSGLAVSGAGDVNGDGFDDLMVSTFFAADERGETYIVFGMDTQVATFDANISLSSLNGTNGFIITGIDSNNNSGFRISDAGDINGDGFNDLLIGANLAQGGNGEAYVIFGKSTGFSANLDLSDLDGNNGFIINGRSGLGLLGASVSDAGDINGDGLDDILIGASGLSNLPGETYVIFGRNTGFNATLEVSSLGGTDGFTIQGAGEGDKLGSVVSGLGDINGDGVDDILAGATGTDPGGTAYILFGIQAAVAPTLANPIADQQTNEDDPFTFTVPANTFEDKNENDIQTLSAQLEGGGMLPSWLSFEGVTGTFSGTPENGDVGTLSIEVTNTDEDNFSISDLFTLEIIGVNDDPGLAAIGNQSGDEGTEITFTASATDEDLPANTLTFSLDQASLDKGMAIEESAGTFSWIPDEVEDGDHDVTVTVSDGTATDSETITITVNEVNTDPVLAAIGDQSGDEGTEITFTASATDEDLPANTLTFSLDQASLDKGMAIEESTGTFSWTPDEEEDGDHDVTVTVSDGTSSDSETITITVNEVNTDPVLAAIGNQSGDEGTEITFTASATDEDLPAITLTFSLDQASLDKGMAIEESTGTFSWTPDEEEDGDHDVTVSVSDGTTTDTETITITVNELNTDPLLAAIGDQSGDEGTEITFTASATDEDLPANTLTFSLDQASLDKGMTIDESTGTFSWTPDEEEDGDHDVTVTVSDGTSTDSETITITVNEVPDIWDGDRWLDGSAPVAGEDARIDGDFDFSTDGTFAANNLEVSSGITLTVDNENTLEVTGDLTNNGNIIVESGSSLITYAANTTAGNDFTIKRNTRYSDGKYSFVGSPVEQNFNVTDATLGTFVYEYDETKPYSTNQGLDRWVPLAGELSVGHGYTQAFQQEVVFVGVPNTGIITFTGTYTEDTDDANEGWNLVSNPYAAAINVGDFLTENSNLTGAVYIWDDNGSSTQRGSNADYIVANGTMATNTTAAGGQTRYNVHLGSAQGFFVKLNDNSDLDIVFTEDMRRSGENADDNFFRKSEMPIIRLNLTSDQGLFKQTVIGIAADATNEKINTRYDASGFNVKAIDGLFTQKADQVLALNGLSYDWEEVNLQLNVGEAGLYNIGLAAEHYEAPLYLRDNQREEIIDLTQGDYHFTANAGIDKTRFQLLSSVVEVLSVNQSKTNIYAYDKKLQILSEDETQRDYKLFTISGREVMTITSSGIATVNLSHLPDGVYVVSDGEQSHKIILE